jgi:hypothetical protein
MMITTDAVTVEVDQWARLDRNTGIAELIRRKIAWPEAARAAA